MDRDFLECIKKLSPLFMLHFLSLQWLLHMWVRCITCQLFYDTSALQLKAKALLIYRFYVFITSKKPVKNWLVRDQFVMKTKMKRATLQVVLHMGFPLTFQIHFCWHVNVMRHNFLTLQARQFFIEQRRAIRRRSIKIQVTPDNHAYSKHFL